MYPALLTGMAVFAFYVVFQMLAQLFGLAYTAKVNLLSTIFDGLSASSNAFAQKFMSVASDDNLKKSALSAEDRERRAGGLPSNKEMWDLVTGVYRAISKYEE